MAGIWTRRGFSVLLVLSGVVVVENSKLNVPRVLLPVFNSLSLNFTLEGTERECYKWSTSRPEIISLTPVSDSSWQDCSSKAIVTTSTRDFVRNTAIVFAEGTRARQIVRCDVITDIISSLSVITTTRELFKEEAPEAFEIRAYDAQGNEFSTLEGVEFTWELSAWNAEGAVAKGTNVIRFITFHESPYETPPSVQNLDNRGLKGHIVLLEGLKTGSARVTVSLPYDEYKRVPPVEVQLSVMSNLIIRPGEAYLMPGDSVQLQVLQVRGGKMEVVSLTKQYSWEVQTPGIIDVDSKTGLVTAVACGKTKVVLKDQEETEKGHKLPTAYITVSAPSYLTLSVLPSLNWFLAVGEHYEIIVEIYDQDDHKLHIGTGVEVQTIIPKEYFSVKEISANGTYVSGEPIDSGTAQIRSTLTTVTDVKGNVHSITPKLSVQANMMIYQKIVVQPSIVILPWDFNLKMRYDVQLNAEGGDGIYTWSSSNSSVGAVTQNGLVTTFTDGSFEVIAAMISNPQIRGVSKFHIATPVKLEIVEYQMETEVGLSVFLHIALYVQKNSMEEGSDLSELLPVTECQEVPFHIHVWNDFFMYNTSETSELVGMACAVIGLTALNVGVSKVSVSLEANALSDSVNIASFLPLKPANPESGIVVLTIGSSWKLAFEGGPVPWIGGRTEHRHTMSVGEDLGVVEMEELHIGRTGRYEYRVLCKKLGEAEVMLTVSNVPIVKHCLHSESTASATILCAKPRYMTLHALHTHKEGCPVQTNREGVILQNYPLSKIFVTVKTHQGRVFHNITSLEIDWTLSDSSLAKITQPSLFVEEGLDGEYFLFFQMLKPRRKSGTLEVKATIVDYVANVLRVYDIVPEYPPFAVIDEKGYEMTPDITGVLSVTLVNDTDVDPKEGVLFNHRANKLSLNLLHGSGYFDLIVSTDKVADVSYKEGSREIEVFPRSEGLVKIAVTDRCLPSEPAVAQIIIVALGSIRVEVPERVEKGKCVTGIVRLFDTVENPLPVPKPDQLDLHPVFEGNIISVTIQYEDLSAPASLAGEIHFVVTGLELGDRRLWFVAGRGEQESRSQAVPIQVFPPLRLLPHNITMVVGSHFQVSSRGGPQPDANVEFSLSGAMARVDKKGLVEGVSLGHGMLVGRAVGFNRLAGQRIVYSQDAIDVFVVPLEGIRIHTPVTRIINGATVPISAHGIPDEITPLILGSTNLHVKYFWSLSSSEIASLHNVYHRVRLAVTHRDLISMHLKTLKPGRVTVSLRVLVPAAMTNRRRAEDVEFETSIEVEVFEELRIIQPAAAGEIQSPYVLMAPNSETFIQTNHEGTEVKYTLLEERDVAIDLSNGTDLSHTVSSNYKRLLTVHPDGRIISHSEIGRGIVLVTVREEFGLRQIMSVAIEVKSVHYMLVSLRPDFIVKHTESISNLPRGAEVELFITYHDNTGIMFTAVEPDIKLRINRFDLTKLSRGIEKNIVLATMMHHGQTMLKVWDEITHKMAADYVRLKTGEGILPPDNTITVGDVICFSVPFVSKTEGVGNWANDNPNVLELNTELGIGRARSPGIVVVKYHFSQTAFTSKEIRVLPVERVKLLPPRDHFITNSDPGALFRVPVVLRSEVDKVKLSSMISRNGSCPMGYMVSVYPFICSLSFSNSESEYDVGDVFAVHQEFDLEKGEYSCAIESAGDPPPHLSTLETNLTMNVHSGDVSSHPLIFRFLPAIYVSTPEIHLSDAHTGTLIINGIPAVLDTLEIIPSNAFISAERVTPQTHIVSSAVYKILLSQNYWEVGELGIYMNVSVVSPRTKQVIIVPIKIHMKGGEKTSTRAPCIVSHVSSWGSTVSDSLYAYRHTLMILTTLGVIILVTAYGYANFLQPLNELRRESLMFSGNTVYGGPRPSMYQRASIYHRPSAFQRQSMLARPPSYYESSIAGGPMYRPTSQNSVDDRNYSY